MFIYLQRTPSLDKDDNDATFHKFLAFLRDSVPESVKVVEDRLASFQTCQPVLQLEREIRQGEREDWVNLSTARRARSN